MATDGTKVMEVTPLNAVVTLKGAASVPMLITWSEQQGRKRCQIQTTNPNTKLNTDPQDVVVATISRCATNATNVALQGNANHLVRPHGRRCDCDIQRRAAHPARCSNAMDLSRIWQLLRPYHGASAAAGLPGRLSPGLRCCCGAAAHHVRVSVNRHMHMMRGGTTTLL